MTNRQTFMGVEADKIQASWSIILVARIGLRSIKMWGIKLNTYTKYRQRWVTNNIFIVRKINTFGLHWQNSKMMALIPFNKSRKEEEENEDDLVYWMNEKLSYNVATLNQLLLYLMTLVIMINSFATRLVSMIMILKFLT